MNLASQRHLQRQRGWREETYRLWERFQAARRALVAGRCPPRVVKSRMQQYARCVLARPQGAQAPA